MSDFLLAAMTDTTAGKFAQMFIAIGLFVLIAGVALFLVEIVRGKRADLVAAIAFIGPGVALVMIGLIYPGILTIIYSFQDATGNNWVGLENYGEMFTNPDLQDVLRNTVMWVIFTPLIATAIGLVYAVLVDRTRGEALAKALIFLPMAISLVGASIIWAFVYNADPDIGIMNAALGIFGIDPVTYQFTNPEWVRQLFLIAVMIWVQAGFAMTILSASIKAIPDEIMEAAALDGVYGVKLFRTITIPSIQPALIVVITTIGIGTLKAFDIVATMTGGNFATSVAAFEFYRQSFVARNQGLGAALAVLLFILVIPIVLYNIRQYRQLETR